MKRILLLGAMFSVTLIYAQNDRYNQEMINTQVPSVALEAAASAEVLQASLYELTDQYLAVHQMHWNVRGPQFYSLHDLLGELYEELAAKIDMVAERQTSVGYPSDGRAEMVTKNADLKGIPGDFVNDYDVVALLSERYKTISDRLGKRIEEISEKDVATQDALIDVRRTIDLHLYKLRSFAYSE